MLYSDRSVVESRYKMKCLQLYATCKIQTFGYLINISTYDPICLKERKNERKYAQTKQK